MSNKNTTATPLCQVAISVQDLARSRSWYEQLGLEPSGAMPPIMDELPARILELPAVHIQVNWLRGRDSMSQLEIMHYLRPTPHPLPPDWGPRHKGYGIVSFVVPDFESFYRRLCSSGGQHAITGIPGSRSLWIADPDGIPLEILERDPFDPDRPKVRAPEAQHPDPHRSARDTCELASIRAVTLTVADLNKARRFWTLAVGLTECSPEECHFNDFSSSLDAGVEEWDQLLLKGGSLILRLLKPRSAPVIPRAPDYRLSDIGVLNVAAIVDSAEAFSSLVDRVRNLGYRFTTDVPLAMPDAAAIYGHDDQGVSIEMGYVLPGHEAKYGWKR
jgi:catechol 2,3-dioxygenase-like lactoylglutathione lyase family enzyme